jgi:hypothetical protein
VKRRAVIAVQLANQVESLTCYGGDVAFFSSQLGIASETDGVSLLEV